MITAVVCRSYEDMARMEKNPEDLFISAMDLGAYNQVLMESDKVMCLNWLDCGGYHTLDVDCGHFPPEYCKRIVDFIVKWHNDPAPRTLNVNCMLGRSRSGAIGMFAWQYCTLDFQDFITKSPQVNPNKHVLRALWKLVQDR